MEIVCREGFAMAVMKKSRRTRLALELLECRVVPATFIVSRSDDDNTTPTVSTPNLSLRQAIFLANQDSDPSSTINIQVPVCRLTIANTAGGQDNENLYGDLDLTKAEHTYIIQQVNPTSPVTISQTQSDRVFQVFPGVKVQFNNVTINGGKAVDDGTQGAQPGKTNAMGGGILGRIPTNDYGSTVILQGSEISGNSAIASENFNAQGGGIHLDVGNSREDWLGVKLSNAKVQKNTVQAGNGGNGNFGGQASGGGISLNQGQIGVEGDSLIANNTVTAGNGGSPVSLGSVNGALGGTSLGGGVYMAKGIFIVNGQLTMQGNSALGGNGSAGIVISNKGVESVGNGGGGGSSRGGGLYMGTGEIYTGSGKGFSFNVLANEARAGAGANAAAGVGDGALGGAGGDALGGGVYLGQASFVFNSASSAIQENKALGGAGGAGGSGGTKGGVGGAGGLSRGGALYGGDSLLSEIKLGQFRFSNNQATGGEGGAGGGSVALGGSGGAGGDSQGGAIILTSFESSLVMVDSLFSGNGALGGAGGKGGGQGVTGGPGGVGGAVLGGAIYGNGLIEMTGGSLTANDGIGGRGGDAGGGSLAVGGAGKGGSVRGGLIAGGVLANDWQPTQKAGWFHLSGATISNNLAKGGLAGSASGVQDASLAGTSQGILQTIQNSAGGFHQGIQFENVIVEKNTSEGSTVDAGAINNGNGSLVLNNCTISGNTATTIAGGKFAASAAGVLFTSYLQPKGTGFQTPLVSLNGTSITDNKTTSTLAGGVSAGSGLVIRNGGTVTLASPLLVTLTDSYLKGNDDLSDKGGGLYADYPQSQVTLVNTNVARNNESDKYPLNVFMGLSSSVSVQPYIYVGSGPGVQAQIGVYNSQGVLVRAVHVFPGFKGGVNVSQAIDPNTGHTFVAAGAGPGGGSSIWVMDMVTGKSVQDLVPFPGFNGPIFSALGDVNNDGTLDVVVGAGQGGPPSVVVFNGKTKTYTNAFYAYDRRFLGGVRVALADTTGDNRLDIVTGSGVGATPTVAIFDSANNFKYVNGFFAYAPGFTSGIYISAADVDGNGIADIITGAGQGGPPNVVLFDSKGENPRSFYAYDSTFHGGVDVGSSQPVGSGLKSDILTASGPGAPGTVAIFSKVMLGDYNPELVFKTGADFSQNGIWVA